MTEITKMAMNLKLMETENNIVSKVDGRRNWFIRTEIRNNHLLIYNCGFGEAKNKGLTSCRLFDIPKYNIRFYTFTYKKNYKKALETLQAIAKMMEEE